MKPPALLLVIGPALAACLFAEEGAPAAVNVPPAASSAPAPDPEILRVGERVYQADCATCHNRGKAGAPRIGEPAAWAPRVEHGRDTLVKRAIRGYSGPAGDEMPARGGNDDLTDSEVSAAVDYILSRVLSVPTNTDSKPTTTP